MSMATLPTLDTEFNQKYQLLAKIGSGGMGDVFLAIQRGAVDFSRLVVIKRIHDRDVPSEYAEAHAKMFLNEASVVASLNHPHIVKIFDFCMASSSFYIVMEYVEGETLKYIVSECKKKERQFPIGLACRVIYDASNTLHYAHNSTSNTGEARKIIHRDIGLHNLMLDSNGYLKIIDFGIAKSSIQTDMTTPGMIKGNPSYMAPELFSNKTQDHRLDIYALGLCFYELLTQTRAYRFGKSATVGEVIQEITQRELPPPSSIVPDLPKGIDEVVMKAVAKDREKRYQHSEEFAQDIKRVSQDIFMAGSEPQKWFSEYFATRLKERRVFGARILEHTRNIEAGTETALPSKLPRGFQIVDDITSSSSTAKTPSPYFHGDDSQNVTKRRLIIAAAVVVSVVLVVLLSFLAFKGEDAKTEGVKVADNLVVSCTPPGAQLAIDGKELGMIGSEGLTFYAEPGKPHEIVVSKDGYRDFTLPFVGPSSGTKRVDVTLIKTETEVAENGLEPSSGTSSAGDGTAASEDTSHDQLTTGDDSHSDSRKKRSSSRSKKRKKKSGKKGEQTEAKQKKRKIPLPDDNEVRKIPVMLD